MARKIHSRYKITGTLITKSPLHIGGLGGNVDSDLAVAVNGKGEYYIPGTSLAGALRNWMEIIAPDVTNELWGYQDINSAQGHASFILVEDAIINLGSSIAEVRDHVAIDRQWGSAVDKMKFDRMILPRGVTIPLKITLERDAKLPAQEWQTYQTKSMQLLNALENEQIALGAAKTRGLGRVKLDKLKVEKQELNNPQGILDVLENQAIDVTEAWINLSSSTQLNTLGKLEIEIHWQPTNPVMVKAEAEGVAVDILPLVSGFDGGITFVLPGSSLKGSLRTQAERIIRTILQKETPRIDDNQNQTFNDQIDLNLVKTLFGSPARLEPTKTDPKEPSKQLQLGYLGALSVDDCFAQITLNSWEEVKNATNEKDLRTALNNNNLNQSQQAFHVAIDRWTGGAADGYLYTILEPMGVAWNPINLSLDLHRLKRINHENEYYPCLVLLLLTLRDLMNERIPLGFGTNRGMGAIKIKEINFKGFGNLDDLNPLNNLSLSQSDLLKINRELLTQLNQRWSQWIKQETLSINAA